MAASIVSPGGSPLVKPKEICPRLKYTIEKRDEQSGIRHVIRELVPEFRDLQDEDFKIESLSGGITNTLFKVSSDKVAPRERELPVIIRVFGRNTESIIDRDKELVIQIESFKNNIGPKVYGLFKNGCVYAYLEGRATEMEEMHDPNILPLIAREVGKWHKLDLPLDKTPSLWLTLHKWKELAPRTFEDEERNKKLQSIDLEKRCKELEELEDILSKLNSPIVFSHNDLLCRNIIIDEATNKLGFIDFEYASYNYRGFDIANHFNEYAGFGPDYSLYPSKDTQLQFLKEYFKVANPAHTETDLENLYVEVNQYSLASHLFWGFWALIQAANSDIDFDFLEYSQARFNQFDVTKEEFLALKTQ